MTKNLLFAGVFLSAGLSFCQAAVDVDWSYHARTADIYGETRGIEQVPGESFTFVGQDNTVIEHGEKVVFYLLTANQYAGDEEEQLYLRWWNGESESWIQGNWVKNIFLGKGGESSVGTFQEEPKDGEVMIDLWRFEVPISLVRTGEHYYCFQMKSWHPQYGMVEKYLLKQGRDLEFGGVNNLGQAWSASPADYFGNDWKFTVVPSASDPL